MTTISNRIRDVLKKEGRAMTAIELAKAIGTPLSSTRNAIYSMRHRKMLVSCRLGGMKELYAFTLGRPPQPFRLDLTDAERAERIRNQKRIWEAKNRKASVKPEKKVVTQKTEQPKTVTQAPPPAQKNMPESIEAFLARGGKIQVLPPGACSKRFQLKSMREIGQETYLRAAEENGWDIRHA
jgi:hypothetical protein